TTHTKSHALEKPDCLRTTPISQSDLFATVPKSLKPSPPARFSAFFPLRARKRVPNRMCASAQRAAPGSRGRGLGIGHGNNLMAIDCFKSSHGRVARRTQPRGTNEKNGLLFLANGAALGGSRVKKRYSL